MPCKLQLFVFMSQWLNNLFFCRKVKSELIKKVISFVNMLSLPLCLMLSFPPLVCGIQKNLLFCRLGAYELDIVAVQGMTLG